MPYALAYLLVDANVLIDYYASDHSILTLAARHLGEVYVLDTVLGEVDGMDEATCEQLGLKVIEPQLDEFTEAAQRRGALSTEDRLCLVVARTNRWTASRTTAPCARPATTMASRCSGALR